MELLKELVRNIIVIIVIGALFDMMMPNSSMNRYLKLVVGLFIIGAMINPLLKITGNPDLASIYQPAEKSVQGEGLETILKNGRDINDKNNEQGIKEYQKRIEQQITALAQLNNEVKVLGTTVIIDKDNGSKNFGRIKEVNLLLAKSDKNDQSNEGSLVAPIEIPNSKEKADRANKLQPLNEISKNKLINIITNFYGLTPRQIHIQNP